MKKSIRRAAVVAATVAALSGLGMSQAFAASTSPFPPPADPSGDLINIWGSNTTQDVYQGLTQGYTLGSTTYTPDSFGSTVGSWDATNPSTGALYDEVTPVAGEDIFHRPDGSGDGRLALSAAWNPANSSWTDSGGNINSLNASTAVKEEEVSASRSSSLPSFADWTQSGVANDLTFIPQAKDAVGVAQETGGSGVAITDGTLTESTSGVGQLTSIYDDTAFGNGKAVGDIIPTGGSNTTGFPEYVYAVNAKTGAVSTEPIIPVLPQPSSGTRSFFLSAIDASSFDTSVVVNETGKVDNNGEENDYNDLSAASISDYLNAGQTLPSSYVAVLPFSGASAIEQNHFPTTSTLPSNPGYDIFPSINSQTLVTDNFDGASASVGTLNTAETPVTAFDGDLVGDFARYVWLVVPSSEADSSPAAPIVTWADTTVLSTTVASGETVSPSQVWTDFGFQPQTSAFASNPSNWVTTEWLNG